MSAFEYDVVPGDGAGGGAGGGTRGGHGRGHGGAGAHGARELRRRDGRRRGARGGRQRRRRPDAGRQAQVLHQVHHGDGRHDVGGRGGYRGGAGAAAARAGRAQRAGAASVRHGARRRPLRHGLEDAGVLAEREQGRLLPHIEPQHILYLVSSIPFVALN